MGKENIGQIVGTQIVDHPSKAIQLTVKNQALTCILDTQASGSFISNRLLKYLPTMEQCKNNQVSGAVESMKYNILGQTVLKARYSGLDIEINVAVIDKLLPDVILGHAFLIKYCVIIDYTSREIFIGMDHRKRAAQW